METSSNESLEFYPAFCFKASPTHFTWVKMGAADVHRLREFGGFSGMSLSISLFVSVCRGFLGFDVSSACVHT
jgi:hypothetical protein